jgi:hypothetical protein
MTTLVEPRTEERYLGRVTAFNSPEEVMGT